MMPYTSIKLMEAWKGVYHTLGRYGILRAIAAGIWTSH